MTFIPQPRIEALADELWQRFDLGPGFDVELLLDRLGLDLLWEQIAEQDGGIILGQLVPGEALVVLNETHRARLESDGGAQRRFTIGHEVGHWTLHSEAVRSGTLSLFDGQRVLCREMSREPVELQAERFAGALLVPREQVVPLLPEHPWSGWAPVYQLAESFRVSPTAMAVRLAELGRAHRDDSGTPVSGPKVPPGQEVLF
jgi:hypothetical protein